MTDTPKDAKKDAGAKGPDELRRQIEETRGNLGETVEELAAKADVKARARERAAAVKDHVQGTAAQVKDKVTEQAARAKGKAADGAGQAKDATAETAAGAKTMAADGVAGAKSKAVEGAARAKGLAAEGAGRAKGIAAEGAGRAKGAVLEGKARAEQYPAVVQAEEKVAEAARRVQDGAPEPVRAAASSVARIGGRHPRTVAAAGAGVLVAWLVLRRGKRNGR
ncbi:DUF3618 domain-containing protein [Streptomyces venezuelae]|uniref:DUF3618 domain-containing protein n=1 Tax=Streptomyces venezuelae TaxID=54571 RepID=UPI001CC226BD|nr:DUF3618 domain-containing protein [Streptomyces venezuelae]